MQQDLGMDELIFRKYFCCFTSGGCPLGNVTYDDYDLYFMQLQSIISNTSNI